jgi:hypothetical protein
MGQFQRPQPTEPGSSYGDKYWDEKSQSWLQREAVTGEERRIAGAPAAGGADDEPDAKEYKRSLDTIKALDERLDPMTAMLIQSMGLEALRNPVVQEQIQGKLTPFEQQQYQMALQFIDYYQKKRQQEYGLGPTQPEQEAATAEDFINRKIRGQ